jgi:ABC-type antimicrobial peptide transport system permease subunit
VVRADPDIGTAAFIQTGIDFRLGGHVLSGFAYTPVKGTFAVSMLTGRVPAAVGEVALGASTAAQLGVRPGATLVGNAENEEAPQVPMRVVGTAVLPPGDVSAHLGDGVIVTGPALVRLAGGRARSPYVIAVTFRSGVDTAQGVARLDQRLSAVDKNFLTQPPTTPTDLVNFGRIQNLPLILASALAALALITVAHLLATSIRRRRRDLAILKTLGFTHGNVGRAVAWQATTLAVVTLAVGVPLGVAAGRTAWRVFAGHLGVVPDVTAVLREE